MIDVDKPDIGLVKSVIEGGLLRAAAKESEETVVSAEGASV